MIAESTDLQPIKANSIELDYYLCECKCECKTAKQQNQKQHAHDEFQVLLLNTLITCYNRFYCNTKIKPVRFRFSCFIILFFMLSVSFLWQMQFHSSHFFQANERRRKKTRQIYLSIKWNRLKTPTNYTRCGLSIRHDAYDKKNGEHIFFLFCITNNHSHSANTV